MLGRYELCPSKGGFLKEQFAIPEELRHSIERTAKKKLSLGTGFRLKMSSEDDNTCLYVFLKWRRDYGVGGCAYIGYAIFENINYNIELSFAQKNVWNYILLTDPAL